MLQYVRYYSQFQGFKSDLTTLPLWARAILALFMLPGLILVGLSIVLLLVSILALLVLTLPVYRLLRGVNGWITRPATTTYEQTVTVTTVNPTEPPATTGRRQIDVRIVE
jgi:hypothetical protein